MRKTCLAYQVLIVWSFGMTIASAQNTLAVFSTLKHLESEHCCIENRPSAGSAQDDVKSNPNAPDNYDPNLASGARAVGVYSGSPVKVKIVSKSGGVYKTTVLDSPNPYILYFKANSVYPYFDTDKLRSLVNEYRAAIEPYVEAYAAKYSLSADAIKGDGFNFDIGHSTEREQKKQLDRSQTRLAELESRLKTDIEAFPQTYTVFDFNPAVVKEIASARDEYFHAIISKKTSLRAEESVWLSAHRDGIRKAQKAVDDYDPATKSTMGTSSEYVLYAVSPKARTKWLTSTNTLEFKEAVDASLAPLAAALRKKLPAYLPPLKSYPLRNPTEEAMMKRLLGDAARYKIYGSGLMPGGWKIETNNLGIPLSRYKHGILYFRDTQADHPYCHATFINIIQSYAGGGTYAASRASLVQNDIVACPAPQ